MTKTFRLVVRSGAVTARAAEAHSVHVEAGGLRAGYEYYYRFRVGDYISPVGRTLTNPARSSTCDLTMCVASCSYYKDRRGYVRTRFTEREMCADFRILPYVRSPGAPASTAASLVAEDGDPTLHAV